MRLRQLGTTQSVSFIAPPEVQQAILTVRNTHLAAQQHPVSYEPINSFDVVLWLLEQSCKSNDDLMPLYLSQCRDFCLRTDSLWKNPNFNSKEKQLRAVLGCILQKEEQTIEQLYGSSKGAVIPALASSKLGGYVTALIERSSHLNNVNSASSALMEVEQEREVVVVVEQIREMQVLDLHMALKFPGIDAALVEFCVSGILPNQSYSFVQAFEYIAGTKIGQKFNVKATESSLFVSREFTRSVKKTKLGKNPDLLVSHSYPSHV